jgi:hypothetical protein
MPRLARRAPAFCSTCMSRGVRINRSASTSATAFAESGHPGATEPAVCAGPGGQVQEPARPWLVRSGEHPARAVWGQFQSRRRWPWRRADHDPPASSSSDVFGSASLTRSGRWWGLTIFFGTRCPAFCRSARAHLASPGARWPATTRAEAAHSLRATRGSVFEPSQFKRGLPTRMRGAKKRQTRVCSAYPNLTTSLSEWLQFGHSKVRLSCPGVAGSMRASIIDVPHFGQGGRTIAREDACVENNGTTALLAG